jgi:hypothetical protein
LFIGVEGVAPADIFVKPTEHHLLTETIEQAALNRKQATCSISLSHHFVRKPVPTFARDAPDPRAISRYGSSTTAALDSMPAAELDAELISPSRHPRSARHR